ncbi:ATG8-interacting protein 1-like isoform X2 [Asparagus officinalis]|nr:ATG8-interacting protein 1-like isoform X2 [Asparagus officinalis]
MAEDEKGGNTSGNGADWEVVSLTASAYAAAPGPKAFSPPAEGKEEISESKEGVDKEEQVDCAAMFMSGHFTFPPYDHKHLLAEPDCKEIQDEHLIPAKEEVSGKSMPDEDICKLKSDDDDDLHGIEFFGKGKNLSDNGMKFVEGEALEELAMVGKEQDIYVDPNFSAFHSKADTLQSVLCNESPTNVEHSDVLLHNPESPSDASKPNEETKLPCEAWWRSRAISVLKQAKDGNGFWSVVVAGAVMGFVILGQRWQKETLQLQQLKWFTISNESLSKMLGPISRFKDILVGGHQRNLSINGGTASNH